MQIRLKCGLIFSISNMRVNLALRAASEQSLRQRIATFVPSMEYYISGYQNVVGTKNGMASEMNNSNLTSD